MIPHSPSRVKRNFGGRAFFCISFRFQGVSSGVKGLGKYEKYELFHNTALLLALAVVFANLKISNFSAVLPFAMLPVTVCAGAAAYFHHKLPESKKCSLFSRRHPTPFFIALLFGNVFLFLEPLIKLWRQ